MGTGTAWYIDLDRCGVFKAFTEIIHFTEDLRDIQVRYDIVHIAEAFSSSNLVSAFLLLLSTPSNSR